jgi:predicted nucleic acid-binding protein
MVALVCSWHDRHAATNRAVKTALGGGAELVLAVHALVECYSVLTRLPAPYRLDPEDAGTLLELNFADTRVVGLTPAEHWVLVRKATALGVAGGRVYDALIARAASKAAPCELLTLNAKDFAALDEDGVWVASP